MKKLSFILSFCFLTWGWASLSDQNLKIQAQTELSLMLNHLLPEDSVSVAIPYSVFQFSYSVTPQIQWVGEFDLSWNQYDLWSLDVENFFFNYKIHPSQDIKIGYFFYPLSFIEEFDELFLSSTLIYDSFYLQKSRDFGLLYSFTAWGFQLQGAFFNSFTQRDADQRAKWSPSLVFNFYYPFQGNHKWFLTYLQKQQAFFQTPYTALGTGMESKILVSQQQNFWLSLKGEAWWAKEGREQMITFYGFPTIQWKSLSLGLFLGLSSHFLTKPKPFNEGWIYQSIAQIQWSFNPFADLVFEAFLKRTDSKDKASFLILEKGQALKLRIKF